MKKVIAILIPVALFFACSKKDRNEGQPDPLNQSKKYAVQFNVASFTQETSDFNGRRGISSGRTAADSLSQYVNYLIYNVYDAETTVRLKAIYQTSRDSVFGQINDSLPAGRYIITITASKDSVFMPPSLYDDEGHSPEENEGIDLSFRPGTDIFYKRIEVGIDDTVNQQLELDRVVSKLKIIIKDRIPLDALKIQLEMAIDPPDGSLYPSLRSFFHFRDGITGGFKDVIRYSPYSIIFPDSVKGKTNFQFERYVINTGTTKTVLGLTCTDTLNHTIAAKVIQNVTLEANRRTVLSGTLFGTPDSGVSVSINPQWRTDSIYGEF